nr:hypothetical protein [Kibdelosporangium sp. MJ126-NF4]
MSGHSGTRLAQLGHEGGNEFGEVSYDIGISIQRETSGVTAQGSDSQRQLGFRHTTSRAGLRAGKPPARDMQDAITPQSNTYSQYRN